MKVPSFHLINFLGDTSKVENQVHQRSKDDEPEDLESNGINLFDIRRRTPAEYSLNILKELFSREELQTRKLPRNRLLKKLTN
ncbi:unnamed protein product [Didymodactylos carnosus]|uniref:Uncharacterized protein n=1 Tax=Didymodactylos carnosus TaxID=1234261 RepID=A0A814RW49_9BILA|nr:unnamed protein product [Didymodactylos carnosus]CAF3903092.1 unnamed protein product [Didymodactylos carnosus]